MSAEITGDDKIIFARADFRRIPNDMQKRLREQLTYSIHGELEDPYHHMLLEAYRAKWNDLLPGVLARVHVKQSINSIVSQLRHNVGDSMREKIKSGKDPLTGLPNKESMARSTQRMINLAKRQGGNVYFLYIDFDHFKTKVNDVLGHEAGDEVIKTMGNIFDAAKRPYDVVGRFSGDEFGITLLNVPKPITIYQFIQRIEKAMESFDQVPGMREIGLSVGISFYDGPDEPIKTNELFNQAEIAMSHSKAQKDTRVKLTSWKPDLEMMPRNTSR